MTGQPDLSHLVLAGMIIAGLGVLNDVTITQASAVWEFREHSPTASFRELFGSGMRVARDHLASTIYTVALAYAGAALPTLVIIHLYQQPFAQVVTSSAIAEEVVRTATGAMGLVIAIPSTTAVAAAAVASSGVVGFRPADCSIATATTTEARPRIGGGGRGVGLDAVVVSDRSGRRPLRPAAPR